MTDLYSQIGAALSTHRRQHETSMYCECGAWADDMDAHRADAVERLVQAALDQLKNASAEQQKRADQLEELLAIAHETSNTAEAERARLAAEVERLGDWCRAVTSRAETAEAEGDRYHDELVVNETDRAAVASQLKRAEAAITRVRAALASFDDRGVMRIGGGNLDIPTAGEVLTAVRAALEEPEERPRTIPDNSPTSSDTADNSALHGLIRQALHDADDHSCQQQDGIDYDRLTAAALDTIRPLGKFLGDMHRDTEADLARVIALYERWVKTGAPPLGVSINRWWDRRLIELRHAIVAEPASDGGPTVREAAADDRRYWDTEREGE